MTVRKVLESFLKENHQTIKFFYTFSFLRMFLKRLLQRKSPLFRIIAPHYHKLLALNCDVLLGGQQTKIKQTEQQFNEQITLEITFNRGFVNLSKCAIMFNFHYHN